MSDISIIINGFFQCKLLNQCFYSKNLTDSEFLKLSWIKSCFDFYMEGRKNSTCYDLASFSLSALFSALSENHPLFLPHSFIFLKKYPLLFKVLVQNNQYWKLSCFCFISVAWVILSNTRMPLGKIQRKWCHSLWSLSCFGLFLWAWALMNLISH